MLMLLFLIVDADVYESGIDLNGVGGESLSCSSIAVVVVVVGGVLEAASSMPLSRTFGSSTFLSSTLF